MPSYPPPAPPQLPAAWNHYLTAALRVLRGQRGLQFAAAAMESSPAELIGLAPGKLLRVDTEFRSSLFRYRLSEWADAQAGRAAGVDAATLHGGIGIESLASRPEHAQACLFVAACDPSGHVRELALRRFAAWPGRLAMAAALIRNSDWVAPVRDAAEALLQRCIEHEPQTLFELMELALPLRERQRFAPAWSALIEPVLHAPHHAGSLWRATGADSAPVREYAYAAAVATGARSAEQACIAAMDDPHPRIARAALAQAETVLTPERFDHQLRLSHRRRVPALRRDALRAAARIGTPSLRACLDAALFDRSSGPRRVAAHLLRERFGEEPRQRWRAALDAGDSASARIALEALSECAQAEDATRFAARLSHASARLRLLALRGLTRSGGAGVAEALAQALHDPGQRVSAEAQAAYKRGAAILPVLALQRAWDLRPPFRARLLAAAQLLDKWQALDFLLRALAQPQPAPLEAAIVGELQTWADRGRYRFGSLADADPHALRERLSHAGARLPDALRHELAGSIPR